MDLQFRELLFFYFTICATPFLALSAYTNMFIGPAKLKPIPEGYEPKPEEYEHHPITRYVLIEVVLIGRVASNRTSQTGSRVF